MQARNRNIEFKEVFSGDMKDAQARYNLGYSSIKKLAAAAGAEIKIGRRTLYNFKKIDNLLNETSIIN